MLELDANGRALVLKPRAPSVGETKGLAGKIKVDVQEVEEAIGKEH